jgi:hypothetical protein
MKSLLLAAAAAMAITTARADTIYVNPGTATPWEAPRAFKSTFVGNEELLLVHAGETDRDLIVIAKESKDTVVGSANVLMLDGEGKVVDNLRVVVSPIPLRGASPCIPSTSFATAERALICYSRSSMCQRGQTATTECCNDHATSRWEHEHHTPVRFNQINLMGSWAVSPIARWRPALLPLLAERLRPDPEQLRSTGLTDSIIAGNSRPKLDGRDPQPHERRLAGPRRLMSNKGASSQGNAADHTSRGPPWRRRFAASPD